MEARKYESGRESDKVQIDMQVTSQYHVVDFSAIDVEINDNKKKQPPSHINWRRINITSKRKTVKYNAEAQTIKLTKNIWETFVVGMAYKIY